jgi:hypothetical protein
MPTLWSPQLPQAKAPMRILWIQCHLNHARLSLEQAKSKHVSKEVIVELVFPYKGVKL